MRRAYSCIRAKMQDMLIGQFRQICAKNDLFLCPLTTDEHILADVATIGKISIVHSILDVVCQTTGMGFAAIARVTDTRWVACAVLDKISFGLAAGGELEIKTTICDEIRENRRPVLI